MNPFLLLTIVVLILIFLLHYKNKKSLIKQLDMFQLEEGYPLIGILHECHNPENIIKFAERYIAKHKDSTLTFLSIMPYFCAMDPDTIEVLLSSTKLLEKSKEYEYAYRWIGLNNLLVSYGETWRNRRKILTPAFHYKILEYFCTIFDKSGRNLILKLGKYGEGRNAFDISHFISLHTLDVISETAMGIEINALNDSNSPYVTSIENMANMLFKRVFSILRLEFLYKLTKYYKIEKESCRILNGSGIDIIKKRRTAFINSDDTNVTDEYGTKSKQTFLDILLKTTIDNECLSDKEILEEVNTFMFEGHDTTAASISFTIYCLSKHVNVQEKVYEEINSLFDKTSEITMPLLQQLNYTEMVIKESLRLYPSVPIIARLITQDTPCRGGILPKGVIAAIIPFCLHRNPKVYPDPYKFDPERFTLENCRDRHPYAYIPFSAGPRNCIGQKFAMLEIKATIVKLLLNYKILTASADFEVDLVPKITLASRNGVQVRLAKR